MCVFVHVLGSATSWYVSLSPNHCYISCFKTKHYFNQEYTTIKYLITNALHTPGNMLLVTFVVSLTTNVASNMIIHPHLYQIDSLVDHQSG